MCESIEVDAPVIIDPEFESKISLMQSFRRADIYSVRHYYIGLAFKSVEKNSSKRK